MAVPLLARVLVAVRALVAACALVAARAIIAVRGVRALVVAGGVSDAAVPSRGLTVAPHGRCVRVPRGARRVNADDGRSERLAVDLPGRCRRNRRWGHDHDVRGLGGRRRGRGAAAEQHEEKAGAQHAPSYGAARLGLPARVAASPGRFSQGRSGSEPSLMRARPFALEPEVPTACVPEQLTSQKSPPSLSPVPQSLSVGLLGLLLRV